MATPPQNNDNIRINAPLNFRHTDTLITTKVPHYPTKLTTGMSIIPGWNRPNANGQNANINDKDYNGPDFKARPLKHWRKQLRVYNYKGPANNSRTASISELERPGTTVYHFTPDCTCVAGEGGNSYIISNNKFGYEVEDNKYSKPELDVQIQNNGFTVVPYYATATQVNDPTNPYYKVLTGLYNTKCINCSPQGNIIRSGIAFQSQAYYSYSKNKLETRCHTYEQNISTNRAPGCVYFDAQGIPLWPTDTPNGPQVVAPVDYQPIQLFNKPCLSKTIYKPNNVPFAKQGAVSGTTRIRKLVSDTVTMNGSSFYSAKGAEEANVGRYQGTNLSSNYYVKIKPVIDSCRGTIPGTPILRVIGNDTYSITVSWDYVSASSCKTIYYTLTYYAINIIETVRSADYIQDFFNSNEYIEDIPEFSNMNEGVEDIPEFSNMNEGVEDIPEFSNMNETANNINQNVFSKNIIENRGTIYTDIENNIRYTIISKILTKDVEPNTVMNIIGSLDRETRYLVSMTATNGNGTSLRSNVVLTYTLLDSNIQINIEPNAANYTYTYNTSNPVKLTVILSSLHTTTPIIFKMINSSSQNVAEITKLEGSNNTYNVVLYNVGTFNLYATQARGLGEFNMFGDSITTTPLITINKDTPILSTPWNIFPEALFIGKTYDFIPASFIHPLVPPSDLLIMYTIVNNEGVESDIVTFIDNNTKIQVNSYGSFQIKATSKETQNYKSVSITSTREYATNMNNPIIEFPSFATQIIHSTIQTFNVPEVKFIYPLERPSNIFVQYSIVGAGANIATINGLTVTIHGVGIFKIRAETNQTSVYNIASVDSPEIKVINIAEQSGTIVWVEALNIITSPTFVYTNPRGTGMEWFAVVDNRSVAEITAYARSMTSIHFTPPGQTVPVLFNNIVTTLITNMSSMFQNATVFNHPISSWDTNRVTNMSSMFQGASAFNQLIGNWNVSSVTNMASMFQGAAAFSQPIGNWNVSSVTNMGSMFQGAAAFSQPIGNWNVSSVTNMSSMFQGASAFNQLIGNWNVSSVTNMGSMFQGASAFNQQIGSWNVSSVTNMGSMFANATSFNQEITTSSINRNGRLGVSTTTTIRWNTLNVIDMSNMFSGATNFNQQLGFSTSQTFRFDPIRQTAIETITTTFSGLDTRNVRNMANMFNGASVFNQPINTNGTSWDTSRVTNMASMFQGATAFNQTMAGWNTANVTTMASMFQNASAFNQQIGNWNTANVTTMASMFQNASAFNQQIGNWNTANVTTMASMFQNASAFNQQIGNWNTANVTTFNGMFVRAITFNQPIGNWSTGNVRDMSDMFAAATIFNQPIGGWNTANVTTMNGMFSSATTFNQPIGNWSTGNVRNMSSMFLGASSFNQPIGGWNTSNVTSMFVMFQSALAFNQAIGNWNTSNVTVMAGMFYGAINFNNGGSPNIGNWNTGQVSDMTNMFRDARLFDQNISRWFIRNFTMFFNFRTGSRLSIQNTPNIILNSG
jgi:surface protein